MAHAPRCPEPSHAARLPGIRRVLLLSGFTFVAWVLGAAAPAFADTLDTLTGAIRHPETAVAQTTAELTELVDTALTTDRLAPLPLPQTELPVDTALAVDVDQLERTDTPLPPPVESRPAPTGTGDSPATAAGTAPEAPQPQPTAPAEASGHATAPNHVPAAADDTVEDESGPQPAEPAAPAPAAHSHAPQQVPSLTGGIVGDLTDPPAVARRDSVTALTDLSVALPPRHYVADPFFSPD
jgi:hypothetical protein